jgi:hypothetical protein
MSSKRDLEFINSGPLDIALNGRLRESVRNDELEAIQQMARQEHDIFLEGLEPQRESATNLKRIGVATGDEGKWLWDWGAVDRFYGGKNSPLVSTMSINYDDRRLEAGYPSNGDFDPKPNDPPYITAMLNSPKGMYEQLGLDREKDGPMTFIKYGGKYRDIWGDHLTRDEANYYREEFGLELVDLDFEYDYGIGLIEANERAGLTFEVYRFTENHEIERWPYFVFQEAYRNTTIEELTGGDREVFESNLHHLVLSSILRSEISEQYPIIMGVEDLKQTRDELAGEISAMLIAQINAMPGDLIVTDAIQRTDTGELNFIPWLWTTSSKFIEKYADAAGKKGPNYEWFRDFLKDIKEIEGQGEQSVDSFVQGLGNYAEPYELTDAMLREALTTIDTEVTTNRFDVASSLRNKSTIVMGLLHNLDTEPPEIQQQIAMGVVTALIENGDLIIKEGSEEWKQLFTDPTKALAIAKAHLTNLAREIPALSAIADELEAAPDPFQRSVSDILVPVFNHHYGLKLGAMGDSDTELKTFDDVQRAIAYFLENPQEFSKADQLAIATVYNKVMNKLLPLKNKESVYKTIDTTAARWADDIGRIMAGGSASQQTPETNAANAALSPSDTQSTNRMNHAGYNASVHQTQDYIGVMFNQNLLKSVPQHPDMSDEEHALQVGAVGTQQWQRLVGPSGIRWEEFDRLALNTTDPYSRQILTALAMTMLETTHRFPNKGSTLPGWQDAFQQRLKGMMTDFSPDLIDPSQPITEDGRLRLLTMLNGLSIVGQLFKRGEDMGISGAGLRMQIRRITGFNDGQLNWLMAFGRDLESQGSELAAIMNTSVPLDDATIAAFRSAASSTLEFRLRQWNEDQGRNFRGGGAGAVAKAGSKKTAGEKLGEVLHNPAALDDWDSKDTANWWSTEANTEDLYEHATGYMSTLGWIMPEKGSPEMGDAANLIRRAWDAGGIAIEGLEDWDDEQVILRGLGHMLNDPSLSSRIHDWMPEMKKDLTLQPQTILPVFEQWFDNPDYDRDQEVITHVDADTGIEMPAIVIEPTLTPSLDYSIKLELDRQGVVVKDKVEVLPGIRSGLGIPVTRLEGGDENTFISHQTAFLTHTLLNTDSDGNIRFTPFFSGEDNEGRLIYETINEADMKRAIAKAVKMANGTKTDAHTNWWTMQNNPPAIDASPKEWEAWRIEVKDAENVALQGEARHVPGYKTVEGATDKVGVPRYRKPDRFVWRGGRDKRTINLPGTQLSRSFAHAGGMQRGDPRFQEGEMLLGIGPEAYRQHGFLGNIGKGHDILFEQMQVDDPHEAAYDATLTGGDMMMTALYYYGRDKGIDDEQPLFRGSNLTLGDLRANVDTHSGVFFAEPGPGGKPTLQIEQIDGVPRLRIRYTSIPVVIGAEAKTEDADEVAGVTMRPEFVFEIPSLQLNAPIKLMGDTSDADQGEWWLYGLPSN